MIKKSSLYIREPWVLPRQLTKLEFDQGMDCMDIRILENPNFIRKNFEENFVMTWEIFQVKQREWIAEMAEVHYPIDANWYNQSFMWDRMDPKYPRVFFREALLTLCKHKGNVFIMSEGESHRYPGELRYHNKSVINFVAQVDVNQLASLVEEEWRASFGLDKQVETNYSPVLPEDLYVFDESMTWFVAFTHEVCDLNAQFSDKVKAADSRLCILGKK
jgi:hypothetical protein